VRSRGAPVSYSTAALVPAQRWRNLMSRLEETAHNLLGFGRATGGILLEGLRDSGCAAEPGWLRRPVWEQNLKRDADARKQ
jgi:hypothetical protein